MVLARSLALIAEENHETQQIIYIFFNAPCELAKNT